MQKDWKKALLPITTTLKEAAETIDSNQLLVVLIVDQSNKLLGMVTDGDIRRAILNGISLHETVDKFMNTSPRTTSKEEPTRNSVDFFKKTHFRHLPVVNPEGIVIGLRLLDEIHQTVERKNKVVLMAGGLGARLGELTQNCPKPLLKVGNKPLLETILENFIEHGFKYFYISVNYKAELIEDYFGNGSKWSVDIQYLKENKRLGTAGALSLIPNVSELPLFIMNGDLLTKVNFQRLLDFHNEHQAHGTMCVREYDFQVPYGVVKVDQYHITKIDEKPRQRFFVNAGIYVISPEALKLIPNDQFYDMPSLFDLMRKKEMETIAFPIHEYWLDIGKKDDFVQANGDYKEVFK